MSEEEKDKAIDQIIKELDAMDLKPKPCPFCGFTKIELKRASFFFNIAVQYSMECERCKAQTEYSFSKASAMLLWNTRV